jgi:hypothetical protein
MSRQPELPVGQEGAMDGTPQPIVPDFVAALRQHMRQEAPDELVGRQGHGSPVLVLGVLIAEAHLAVLDGEQAGVGQRDPVDLPAEVIEHPPGAWHGGCAVDDPPSGPDRFRNSQVGVFLTHQLPKPSAKELRESLHRHQVGCTGRPPLGSVRGNPTGRYEAMHVRMVSQRAGPGVEHTQDSNEPPDIMGVRRALDARLSRGAEHDVVEILLMPTDDLS